MVGNFYKFNDEHDTVLKFLTALEFTQTRTELPFSQKKPEAEL